MAVKPAGQRNRTGLKITGCPPKKTAVVKKTTASSKGGKTRKA